MANIRENKKNGKIISFRFIVCLERDVRGKQIRKYTTWTPPEGMTAAKAKKAAERAADAWENEIREEYQKQKELGSAYRLPPDKRRDDFVSFVNDTWFVLLEMSRNVQSGNTQNLKSMVIQRSFPKWSVAERRKTAAASDQAAVCACAHSRYFAGGSPSGLRV